MGVPRELSPQPLAQSAILVINCKRIVEQILVINVMRLEIMIPAVLDLIIAQIKI